MTISGRRKLFRILQFIAVSFFLAAPLIKTSNGYSLIGFDVELLRLYFFNSILTFENFFVASLFILLTVFLFIVVTQIFGRIWCGWLCPQSVFTKLKIDIADKFKKQYRKVVSIFLAALFAVVVSCNWMFYFISPSQLFYAVFTDFGSVSSLIWLVLFISLFIDFAFAGFLWCHYVCPYAKMQTLMTDSNTLYVGLLHGQEDKCINCMACVKKCPAKIDPRKTPDNGCVYCETCIITCEKILSKKGGRSVLGYNWGSDEKFTFKRTNLLITLFIIALLSVMIVVNIINSAPLTIKYDDILTTDSKGYKTTLTIKNGSVKNTIVTFTGNIPANIEPKTVSLRAKETKTVTVTITPDTTEFKGIEIEASASSGYKNLITLKKN